MSASATIRQSAVITYSKTTGGAVYSGQPTISVSDTLTNSDISKVYSSSATISSATPIDFTSLTDVFGSALNFTGTLKGLYVYNTHATATLTVGGGSNPILSTDQITLAAGSAVILTSPVTVDGTHKVLTLTPSASCSYQIIAVG